MIDEEDQTFETIVSNKYIINILILFASSWEQTTSLISLYVNSLISW